MSKVVPLLNQAPRREDALGSGGTAPRYSYVRQQMAVDEFRGPIWTLAILRPPDRGLRQQ